MTDEQRNFVITYIINKTDIETLNKVFEFDIKKDHKAVNALMINSLKTGIQDDIECALAVAFIAGLKDTDVPTLMELLKSEKHSRHEDIVGALQGLKDPISIDVIFETATKDFDYLNYDEEFGLARKCAWALADIGTPESLEKLKILSNNKNPKIAGHAKKRIDNWENERERKRKIKTN